MKLDEAIKIHESILDGTYDHRDEDMEDALKLGIEALKRIKRLRDKRFPVMGEELPGEDPIIDTTRSKHHINQLRESPLGREPTPKYPHDSSA